MNVRKFVLRANRLQSLVELGSLSPRAASFLDASVRAGLNILVAGGTQTGKTFLNCRASSIPGGERVVSAEEAFELRFRHRSEVGGYADAALRASSRPPSCILVLEYAPPVPRRVRLRPAETRSNLAMCVGLEMSYCVGTRPLLPGQLEVIRMIRRLLVTVGVLFALLAPQQVLAQGPTSDARRAGPKVVLSIAVTRVDQGTPITVKVKAKNLPPHTKVILQRTSGTGKKFSNLRRVGKRGLFTVAGVPQGKYRFRLTLIRYGASVGRSKPVTLYSYGPLTVDQYCNASEVAEFYDSCGNSGTITAGGNVFAYTNASDGTSSASSPAIKAQNSSCNFATFDFAMPDSSAAAGVTYSAASFAQETTPLQTINAPIKTIGTASFPITSRAWNLILWHDGGTLVGSVFYRGVLNCYTATGED